MTKPFTPQALQAALARALDSCEHKSRAVALPPQPPEVLVDNLKEINHAVIEAVIERCRGNKAAAARVLGLHRRTLYRILRGETGHEQPGESREDCR